MRTYRYAVIALKKGYAVQNTESPWNIAYEDRSRTECERMCESINKPKGDKPNTDAERVAANLNK